MLFSRVFPPSRALPFPVEFLIFRSSVPGSLPRSRVPSFPFFPSAPFFPWPGQEIPTSFFFDNSSGAVVHLSPRCPSVIELTPGAPVKNLLLSISIFSQLYRMAFIPIPIFPPTHSCGCGQQHEDSVVFCSERHPMPRCSAIESHRSLPTPAPLNFSPPGYNHNHA